MKTELPIRAAINIFHLYRAGELGSFSEELKDIASIGFREIIAPGVDLSGEDLSGADFTKAQLQGASLNAGRFNRANFNEADLSHARLLGAKLFKADLRGALLYDADLRESDLRGADLRGTKLDEARLDDALFDWDTKWPTGFNPLSSGAVHIWLRQIVDKRDNLVVWVEDLFPWKSHTKDEPTSFPNRNSRLRSPQRSEKYSGRALAGAGLLIIFGVIAYQAITIGLPKGPMTGTQVNRPGDTLEANTPSPQTVAITDPSLTATTTGNDTVSGTTSSNVVANPQPSCSLSVAPELQMLWNHRLLGCPTGPAMVLWAAVQDFEGGFMFWREDQGGAYSFLNNGTWIFYSDVWDGIAPSYIRGVPPGGLQHPVRGFGYLWGKYDEIFSNLGWALANEQGVCVLAQDMEEGFLLTTVDSPLCPENLYVDPTYQFEGMSVSTSGKWMR